MHLHAHTHSHTHGPPHLPPSSCAVLCILYWPGLGRPMLYLARGESQCPALVSLPSSMLLTAAPTPGPTHWALGRAAPPTKQGGSVPARARACKEASIITLPLFPLRLFHTSGKHRCCQACWCYTHLITHLQSCLFFPHTNPPENGSPPSLGYSTRSQGVRIAPQIP